MKILLADDDPITRAILARQLQKWGYDVIIEVNGEAALQRLERDREIRLCILDWIMPGMSGPEVCREIRRLDSEPYVYTILLTSNAEAKDVVSGLEAGADDYLVKPCNPFELEVRLRAGRRVVELQANLIAAREQLRIEATHDALTGLLNRRATLAALHLEMNRAGRQKTGVSVIMVDVDHFKSINDTYGHEGGDEVLKGLAERLRAALRPYDVCGRLGGEEFVLVASGCGLDVGAQVAERVRRVVADTAFVLSGGRLPVTVSIGVSALEQYPRGATEDLIRGADGALYRSKRNGRNRVTLAEPIDFSQAPLPPKRESVLPRPRTSGLPEARVLDLERISERGAPS